MHLSVGKEPQDLTLQFLDEVDSMSSSGTKPEPPGVAARRLS